MSKLNKDVIFLILKELQNDPSSFYSCLLINRIWCETTVPILWKNPAKLFRSYKRKCKAKIQKKPLFNYIRYWRYLDLNFLEYLLNVLGTTPLSLISGFEDCFSKLEYFYCNNKTSSKILEGLAQTNKQIRKFEIIIMCDDRENSDNSTEVVKLIEAQGNLKEINFIRKNFYMNAKSYCKNLEESLIKHADTVQYLRIDWEPITKFLSYLVNLVSLDLTYICYERDHYDNLKTISLPLLKFLKAKHIPSNILSSLIESTKGYLVEISILYHYIFDKGRLIRAIYQNCLNLKILKLSMTNENISDFEYLLINCQYLNSLEVIGTNYFDWDELFEILTKSSPIGLFKFTFTSPISDLKRKMNSIKLFLDNWKDRHSMSLYIVSLEEAYMKMLKQQRRKFQQQDKQQQQILENLLQQYVAIGSKSPLISGSEDCFSEIEYFCCYSDKANKLENLNFLLTIKILAVQLKSLN
ncbi:hypothetical protein RhiirA5_415613 [Rhizophagus irregularis]|uniref:F-box domain-containing protein n=1 Tax=Rhizophagus irregularis TaxID=588596 RepID=A0A2N0PRQ7_9GLOM|nr:hypothetical protein RhiirA5_415613 [Rhizophagus irregularis]